MIEGTERQHGHRIGSFGILSIGGDAGVGGLGDGRCEGNRSRQEDNEHTQCKERDAQGAREVLLEDGSFSDRGREEGDDDGGRGDEWCGL